MRYVDNDFQESSVTTIGIDYKTKTVFVDGYNVKLQIWVRIVGLCAHGLINIADGSYIRILAVLMHLKRLLETTTEARKELY